MESQWELSHGGKEERMKDIRLLKAEEISVKVKTVYNGNALLLLYKDARVDMTILDETFGAMNWKRSHKEVKGNLFCTIGVWDGEKWVEKEDVGIESYTEAEKGEASDSFKRAGTNWGIGRELYTSPKIIVRLNRDEFDGKKVYTSFYVSNIGYNENREISNLTIIDGNGRVRFQWSNGQPKGNQPAEEEAFDLEAYRADVEAMLNACELIDNDKKALTLKCLPRYDKKLLDMVVARIKELENQNY
jgi:hypothetical protein